VPFPALRDAPSLTCSFVFLHLAGAWAWQGPVVHYYLQAPAPPRGHLSNGRAPPSCQCSCPCLVHHKTVYAWCTTVTACAWCTTRLPGPEPQSGGCCALSAACSGPPLCRTMLSARKPLPALLKPSAPALSPEQETLRYECQRVHPRLLLPAHGSQDPVSPPWLRVPCTLLPHTHECCHTTRGSLLTSSASSSLLQPWGWGCLFGSSCCAGN